MPNHAKCGPACPVSANLKLPQMRAPSAEASPIGARRLFDGARPDSPTGEKVGMGDYCLLTGCGAYEPSKLTRSQMTRTPPEGISGGVRLFSVLFRDARGQMPARLSGGVLPVFREEFRVDVDYGLLDDVGDPAGRLGIHPAAVRHFRGPRHEPVHRLVGELARVGKLG